MDFIKNLWRGEPALVVSAIVSVIVVVSSQLGLVLDEQSLAENVGEVLLILLGGATVRSKVTPTN